MPTQVECPSCGRPLRVPDELLGRAVRCPGCQATFTAADPTAPGEPPADEGPAPDPAPAGPEGANEERVATRRRESLSPPAEESEAPPWRGDEDEDYRPSRRPPGLRRDVEPDRGALILILGIMSIAVGVVGLCCLSIVFGPLALGLGIPAWVMGPTDRRTMAAGQMDPAGMGLTTGGWVCGIVGTCVGVVAVLCAVAGLVFVLGSALFK